MAILTLAHAGGAAGNINLYTAVGTANQWDAVLSAEATQYAQCASTAAANGIFDDIFHGPFGVPFYNPAGLNPTDVIANISFRVVRRNNDANACQDGVFFVDNAGNVEPSFGNNFPLLAGSAIFTEASWEYPVNPVSGAAWVYNDLFLDSGGGNFGGFAVYRNGNGFADNVYQIDRIYLIVTTVDPPSPPRRTQDGSLALPTFDIDAMASGDPDRMAVAMRDGMTALTRTLQQISNLLSRPLIDVRWVAQPYSGALYTVESPDGGVWTVEAADQIEFDYIRLGDTLFIQLVLDATSTLAGKTYTSLYVQIPGGYRTQGGVLHSSVAVITPGAVAEEIGLIEANGQGAGQPVDKLRIRRLPIGTNFPAGLANTMALRLAILFRIVPPPTAK